MPWLTPDSGTPLVNVQMQIPEEFCPLLEGAILELTYPENWEQRGTLTPEECAEIAVEAVRSIEFSDIP